MKNFQKFEGIDYLNNFARKISSIHNLVSKHLKTVLNDGDRVIDIGGGPGMGAILMDNLGKKVTVLNIEPSNNVKEVPTLNHVEYSYEQLTLKEALDFRFPWKADCFLMVSAAHEIALANGKKSLENKRMFYRDLKLFLKQNSWKESMIIIGFPNYIDGVTPDMVIRQRERANVLMGHSHPPDEFFTIEEFSTAFSAKPLIYDHVPMILGTDIPEETCLRANLVIFRIGDILLS